MFLPLSLLMSSASGSATSWDERSKNNNPVPLGLPKFKRGGIFQTEEHYMTYNEQCEMRDICLDIYCLTNLLSSAAVKAEQDAECADCSFMGDIFLKATARTMRICEEKAKEIIFQLSDFMNDSEKDYFSKIMAKLYGSQLSLS